MNLLESPPPFSLRHGKLFVQVLNYVGRSAIPLFQDPVLTPIMTLFSEPSSTWCYKALWLFAQEHLRSSIYSGVHVWGVDPQSCILSHQSGIFAFIFPNFGRDLRQKPLRCLTRYMNVKSSKRRNEECSKGQWTSFSARFSFSFSRLFPWTAAIPQPHTHVPHSEGGSSHVFL